MYLIVSSFTYFYDVTLGSAAGLGESHAQVLHDLSFFTCIYQWHATYLFITIFHLYLYDVTLGSAAGLGESHAQVLHDLSFFLRAYINGMPHTSLELSFIYIFMTSH